MNPQNFMLGIRDIFAVLIPGSALLLLFQPAFMGQNSLDVIVLLAFAVMAYVLGSALFVIGAFADPLAVWLIRRLMNRGKASLDRNGGASPRVEWAVDRQRRVLTTLERIAVQNRMACTVRNAAVAAGTPEGCRFYPDQAGHVKGFWWDQLRLNCPPAVAELDRLEGIQKLFRTRWVVLALALLWSLILPGVESEASLEISQRTSPLRAHRFPFYAAVSMIICFAMYVWNRWRFDAAVYRLSVAFILSGRIKAHAEVPANEAAQSATGCALQAGGELLQRLLPRDEPKKG